MTTPPASRVYLLFDARAHDDRSLACVITASTELSAGLSDLHTLAPDGLLVQYTVPSGGGPLEPTGVTYTAFTLDPQDTP